MPTRQQVIRALEKHRDYAKAARRLRIPQGQVYLIATGLAADGGDVPGDEQARRWALSSSQHLVNPPHENPTSKESVGEWIRGRVSADVQMREAARRRTAQPGEVWEPEVTDDAVVLLTRDHTQVKAMLKQLDALPSRTTGGSRAQLSMRKSVVDMMTVALSQHEAVEEDYLWPMVRRVLPDGDRWADGALEQEQEGKETLTALGRLRPKSEKFDTLVERLVLQLRRHVAYEERLFLELRASVPQEQLEQLGRTLARAKRLAPTRPHRHAPQRPPAVKVVGAMGAAGDRLRDAAGWRPAKRKGRPSRWHGR